MYDNFLRMDLPAGTSNIGFADDELLVYFADHGQEIVIGKHEVVWKKTIKYLGVELDRGLASAKTCRSRLPKPSNVEPT